MHSLMRAHVPKQTQTNFTSVHNRNGSGKEWMRLLHVRGKCLPWIDFSTFLMMTLSPNITVLTNYIHFSYGDFAFLRSTARLARRLVDQLHSVFFFFVQWRWRQTTSAESESDCLKGFQLKVNFSMYSFSISETQLAKTKGNISLAITNAWKSFFE